MDILEAMFYGGMDRIVGGLLGKAHTLQRMSGWVDVMIHLIDDLANTTFYGSCGMGDDTNIIFEPC